MQSLPAPLVINLLAGPNADKSAMAADIFAELKRTHPDIGTQLVTEFAQELALESRHGAIRNQLYVLGEQTQRIERAVGQADVIITDSPPLLSMVYRPVDYPSEMDHLALWYHRRFPSIDAFVQRFDGYDPRGRVHDHSECLELDSRILECCEKHDISPLEHVRNEPPHVHMIVKKAASMVRSMRADVAA